ncbi:amidase [Listeria monocytogenes]|uniref:amidase n=1 Tax=Listeria monocytogenes TaxID=1639 RepID=UPI00086D51CF|nr:amidase [Listeria monocytogenes]MCY61140.1 amidase [Listeria monocytogenes serotype 4c]EAC4663233.1 amidase [Listeria monocytogenes]EAC5531803.1 amidase [Listeria monocytogenes]EAC6221495.1 amidase [Listeria monocytogenes]EAC7842231.1 amidase [Listeria monocytogenes]
MKKRIILTSIAVCAALSLVGGYFFLDSQQTSTPEKKSAVSKKSPHKHSKINVTIGKNKENFHLEKDFGDKQLEVERITGRVSQSTLKQKNDKQNKK